jgi:predicted nucleic acid-binding protein
MAAAAPYGGRPLIADTSVWTALERARKIGNVPPDWARAIEADQILTSPIVELELLHSARNAPEFEDWRARLSVFRPVQLTNSACNAAIQALWELSSKSDGYHRVGLGDALIAASAQDAGVGVLHYNARDFGKLSEVLSFDSVAFGRPGEFELPRRTCWDRLIRSLRRLAATRQPGRR